MVFECICVFSWQVWLACGQDLTFETQFHALNGTRDMIRKWAVGKNITQVAINSLRFIL